MADPMCSLVAEAIGADITPDGVEAFRGILTSVAGRVEEFGGEFDDRDSRNALDNLQSLFVVALLIGDQVHGVLDADAFRSAYEWLSRLPLYGLARVSQEMPEATLPESGSSEPVPPTPERTETASAASLTGTVAESPADDPAPATVPGTTLLTESDMGGDAMCTPEERKLDRLNDASNRS